MGRRPKYSKEVKIKACEDYLNGKGSIKSISKHIGCNHEILRQWIIKYKIHGSLVFDTTNRNRAYSAKFKQSVINECLTGTTSLPELAGKYNISYSVIQKWVNNDYNGIQNKDYDPKGDVYTMESRKLTYEERLEIVKWVIANNLNYKEAADKNGIKYALIYQWVQKYLKNGSDGLKHKKRGPKKKAVIDETTLTEVERLKLELQREKSLRERAEFRLELFKKKEEFAQKRRSQK